MQNLFPFMKAEQDDTVANLPADQKGKHIVWGDKLTKPDKVVIPDILKEEIYPESKIDTSKESDPCIQICMKKGFCCNDPKSSMNKLLSCAQACKMREFGVPEDQCKSNCTAVEKDKKCETKFQKNSYDLCSTCIDLKTNCPLGVQSVDECT